MFCTVCEITTTDLSHYRTPLHNLNAKRKIVGYPPLTIEEFDSESVTDDLSLNLDFNSSPTAMQFPMRPSRAGCDKKCMLCGEDETATHHRSHGLSDEQAYYLKNGQCYVCYERFCDCSLLIKHIDSGNHRTAVTDGTSLYLENGKVLNPERMQIPGKLTTRSETSHKTSKKVEKVVEKAREAKEHGQLVVSIANNRVWGKFLH